MKRKKKQVAKKVSKKAPSEPEPPNKQIKKRSVRDRVHLAIMADAKTLLFATSTMKGIPQGQVIEESVLGYVNRQPKSTRDSIMGLYENLLAQKKLAQKKTK